MNVSLLFENQRFFRWGPKNCLPKKYFFTDIFNNEVCSRDIAFGYFQKNEELKGNNELNQPLPYQRNSTSHHFTNIFLISPVICHFSELSSRILAHPTARVRNVRNKILRSFCIKPTKPSQQGLGRSLASSFFNPTAKILSMEERRNCSVIVGGIITMAGIHPAY